MPASFESSPALRRFRREFPRDATIYEQGTVPDFFYVLISGRVVFEIVDSLGARMVVDEVAPGTAFGVVGSFTARPTSAAARTTAPSQLLAIPVRAASQVFEAVPDLAVMLVRQLAAQPPRATRHATAEPDPDAVGRNADEPTAASAAAPPPVVAPVAATREPSPDPAPTASQAVIALPGSYNEAWFFPDSTRCPACQADFAYLRVRASAVRPTERDSDFRLVYKTVDPSLYAVVVCPACAYASYIEDFRELTAAERASLVAVQAERVARLPKNLCGERDIDDGMLALELAQLCAETRGAGRRRKAGLLHRRAWLERTRGDDAAERALLQETLDTYREVYELDPDIQDAAAMRVAYLIGDITLRLGNASEGQRWLMECIRTETAEAQTSLVRMARLRLEDVREIAHANSGAHDAA